MKILLTLLAIIVMIIIHELGHFIAGRICKIPIAEFSIGFGKALWQKKGKRETTYSIRAIPLGGYCGFDEDDATGAVDTALNNVSIPKRLFVFVAGPLMNILTCIILLFVLAIGPGVPIVSTTVDLVQSGYDAEGKLEHGDTIVAIDGQQIPDVYTVNQTVLESEGPLTITVERDGKDIDVVVEPKLLQDNKTPSLGVVFMQKGARQSFVGSILFALNASWHLFVSVLSVIGGLFTGAVSVGSLSSIVGASDTVSVYATPSQFPMFIYYCGYISLNLGIMNLLPIPALDGFRILTGTIEGITRKKIPEKVEAGLITVSLVLLVGFASILMLRDAFFMAKNLIG